jgi:protein SCO1
MKKFLQKTWVFFLFLEILTCKANWEKGDIKYLPKDWDAINATSQKGEIVSLSSLRGTFKVLYFGFSHCPDMCPMALTNLSNAISLMGEKAPPFRVVFLSLDPERDTPEMLQKYAKMFPENQMLALTPSESEMQTLMNIFGIYREKKSSGKGYTIEHSNFLFLIGKETEQIATFLGDMPTKDLSEQLLYLIPKK